MKNAEILNHQLQETVLSWPDSGHALPKMNFLSFLFVILIRVVKQLLEVLNSCLSGLLMLHSFKRVQ